MHVDEQQLGDFLLDARLLSRTQLEDARESASEQGESLHTALARAASVPEDELRRAVAHVTGVPFVVLAHEDISLDALMLVPEPLARAHSLAAVAVQGNSVELVLLNLDDLAAVEFLSEEQHYKVLPRLTDRATFKRALMLQQKLLKEKFGEHMKNVSDASVATDALLSHALLARERCAS